MARIIKFRGLVSDTKNWVYGYYFNHADADRIFVSEKGSFTVLPESVGQFTGLFDKNGIEIYEGDILEGVNYQDYKVFWDTSFLGWNIGPNIGRKVRVIGNIHESEVQDV